MAGRTTLLALVLTLATLAAAAPASASLADEVRAGRAVAADVDAGTVRCSALDDTDFEHLGEYVMERMAGSRTVHQAMNDRMSSMMGSANAERMHELLGRRYAGCAVDGAGSMMGPGMMGGGWGAMMGGPGTSWMRNGTWQHMSRDDWDGLGSSWMGGGMRHSTGHWSTGAVVAAIIGGLLVVVLLAIFLAQRPSRRPPTPGPAT